MTSPNLVERDSVVTQSHNQVGCELDGETVMMHVDTGEYFGCDQIGTHIWRLIKQPRSVADLCVRLVEDYDVQPTQCEQEVLAFLNELAAESLVDVKHASAA